MGENLGKAEFRSRSSPCVERRLDELAAAVDEAAQTGKLAPLGAPDRAQKFTWDMGVWQSAVSAQTVTHMGRSELKGYTSAYEYIKRIQTYSEQEDQTWVALYGLVGQGRRFDPAEASAFRRAISEARFLDRAIAGSGLRARLGVEAQSLRYDHQTFRKEAEEPINSLAICKSIEGPPPAHYGAAPWEKDGLRQTQSPGSTIATSP